MLVGFGLGPFDISLEPVTCILYLCLYPKRERGKSAVNKSLSTFPQSLSVKGMILIYNEAILHKADFVKGVSKLYLNSW